MLEVIEKIYDNLGESYMVLIPETIPFLSEVLEGMSFVNVPGGPKKFDSLKTLEHMIIKIKL